MSSIVSPLSPSKLRPPSDSRPSSFAAATTPQHEAVVDRNVLQVLDRQRSVLLSIPRQDVFFIPDAKRLVLCERFDVNDPENSCRYNNSRTPCRFVHADIRNAIEKPIHINWAWRSIEECPFERLPPGRVLVIHEPASAKSHLVDHIPSELLLKTRCVFDDPNRKACHCAHFYYGRECHLGPKCDFAHVLFIDPRAGQYELAPGPCTFGRGRTDKSVMNATDLVAEGFAVSPQHHAEPPGRIAGVTGHPWAGSDVNPHAYNAYPSQDITVTVTCPPVGSPASASPYVPPASAKGLHEPGVNPDAVPWPGPQAELSAPVWMPPVAHTPTYADPHTSHTSISLRHHPHHAPHAPHHHYHYSNPTYYAEDSPASAPQHVLAPSAPPFEPGSSVHTPHAPPQQPHFVAKSALQSPQTAGGPKTIEKRASVKSESAADTEASPSAIRDRRCRDTGVIIPFDMSLAEWDRRNPAHRLVCDICNEVVPYELSMADHEIVCVGPPSSTKAARATGSFNVVASDRVSNAGDNTESNSSDAVLTRATSKDPHSTNAGSQPSPVDSGDGDILVMRGEGGSSKISANAIGPVQSQSNPASGIVPDGVGFEGFSMWNN